MSKDIIEKLFKVIETRKDADPKKSYVASLYAKGTKKIAQKVGEEAVEVAIEAARDKKKLVKEESADLLLHLMVLWSQMGLKPKDILGVLEDRFGQGGLDEKAGRKK